MTVRAADLRQLRQILKRQAHALDCGDLPELTRDYRQIQALTDRLEDTSAPAGPIEARLLTDVQGLAQANARRLRLRLEGRARAMAMLVALVQGQGLATYARDGTRQSLAGQSGQLERRS